MRHLVLASLIPLVLAFPAIAQAPFAGADSVRDFSGVQGQAGWHYGYWDVTNDPDGVYHPSDFRHLSVWTGSQWRLSASSPPWTMIDAVGCHPDDGSPGPEVVAVRRWVSPVQGLVRLSGTIAKIAASGNGVIARFLVNGVDHEFAIVPGWHVSGHRYDLLVSLDIGDALDMMLFSWGDDGSDYTRFDCTVSPQLPVVASSSAQFSATQRRDGWRYGYYDGDQPAPFTPADFEDMTQVSAGTWGVNLSSYWTSLTAYGGHSNGHVTSGGRLSAEQWAVRRWESTVEGSIELSGLLAKANVGGGNGVTGRIFSNGVEVWNGYVAGYEGHGIAYTLQMNVTRQSVLDFALDPTASDDLADTATFTADIRLVERYGSGTPGCNGPSLLFGSAVPRIGATDYSLQARQGPSAGLALCALAMNQDLTGTVLPGIGVVLLVVPTSIAATFVATADPWGQAAFPIPVPGDPSLAAARIFAQVLWAWPTSPPNCQPLPTPLGVSSTNGLLIQIQLP